MSLRGEREIEKREGDQPLAGAGLDPARRQADQEKEDQSLEHHSGQRMKVGRGPLLNVVLNQRRGQRPQGKDDGLKTERIDEGQPGAGDDPPAQRHQAAPWHRIRVRSPAVEDFTGEEEQADDDAHQECGVQVRPQPDEGRQHEDGEPAASVPHETKQEQAAQQHVEELGSSPPGRRAGEDAHQGQGRGRARRQAGLPQEQVKANRGRRHDPSKDGDHYGQPAKLVEPIHRKIGQPFVHHPGLAGGAERVDIQMGNGRRCQDQPSIGQVPPQIRVQWGHRGQTEDRRKEERAEQDRTGDAAKPGGDHGQESNGPVTDFLRPDGRAGAR